MNQLTMEQIFTLNTVIAMHHSEINTFADRVANAASTEDKLAIACDTIDAQTRVIGKLIEAIALATKPLT